MKKQKENPMRASRGLKWENKKGLFNMRRDNLTFDATIQHACGNWVLKRPALLAPGN